MDTAIEWGDASKGHSAGPGNIIGISGRVGYTTFAGADFPFAHPFGYNPADPSHPAFSDWESFVVVDSPYDSLLAPGNKAAGGEYFEACASAIEERFGCKLGIMGIEFDRGLIPPAYQSQVGDWCAAFGTYIIDCGHPDYHAEIHPPLLLVNARPRPSTPSTHSPAPQSELPVGVDALTSATVISCPYSVSQRYRASQVGSDEPFLNSALMQMAYAMQLANLVAPLCFFCPTYQFEFRPVINELPFQGLQIMRFAIRPTTPSPPNGKLWARWHLTARTGVDLQVLDTGDSLSVICTMNDAVFTSANKLLRRHDRTISRDDMYALGYGWGYDAAFVTGHTILPGIASDLSQGFVTDCYETLPPTSPHDGNTRTLGASGPAADISDEQPYPVYGWLEVGWHVPIELKPHPCVRGLFDPKHYLAAPVRVTSEDESFVYQQKGAKTFTITNLLDQPIRIQEIKLDPSGPPFRIAQAMRRPGAPPPPSFIDLPAHGAHYISINFNPATEGQFETELHVLVEGKGCYVELVKGSVIR